PLSVYIVSLFFFSSRRRHTRSKRDWSSDVCSSDLIAVREPRLVPEEVRRLTSSRTRRRKRYSEESLKNWYPVRKDVDGGTAIARSEERRVGKEGRWEWAAC